MTGMGHTCPCLFLPFMSTLTLSAYSLSVVLSKFGSANRPREVIEPVSVSFTASGTPNRRGTSYYPKHLWSVDALVSADQADALQSMFDLYQASPSAITVDDLISPFTEATKTRATAAGAGSPVAVGSNTRYFARFNAEFQGALKVQELGVWRRVVFQLIETTVVGV